MSSAEKSNPLIIWQASAVTWMFLCLVLALLGLTFYEGIKEMVYIWNVREEYSYGYMIPFITAFFIWQKKNEFVKNEFLGSWLGVPIIVLGLILFILGSLSTITTIIQYALLIVVFGIALSIMGWQALRPVFVPLSFLIFMIPLPGFFLNNLSSQLQLVSSEIGVAVIRVFGISVFLEGNVIDLGTYKLQVVEACSGLRYLFPLMSLAFICAYIFKGAFWKRAIIFLSSIPITVLMNSFRIGVIGVLVEYWGPAQAEGFLHDFEGWIVFMACFAIILGEMFFLVKIGTSKMSLRDAFSIEMPESTPKDAEVRTRKLSKQYLVVGGLLLAAVISSHFIVARPEIVPLRQEFAAFPMSFDVWRGKQTAMDKIYLDALKLDDYILADYVKWAGESKAQTAIVNLYMAYYASQRAGESAHSPRSCIPGGGWRIQSLNSHSVDGVIGSGGNPLTVNRLIIQKGEYKQLVYYWFQQRGRVITNEYMVKWYLFWDALTRNRTDGALVRLTAMIPPGENVATAEKQLMEFTGEVAGRLKEYIPD